MKKILLLLIGFLFTFSSFGQLRKATSAEEKFSIATFIINQFYVDTINKGKLFEDALIAMLKDLDPHSEYMTKEEVKAFNEPMVGNFDGIGVQFNMLQDTLYVVQAVSGAPAEKVGVRAGDKIIMVSDTCIAGVKMPTSKIMKMLRGPKGSKVMIKVARQGVKEPIDFTIVRDKIPLYSLDAAYMVNKKVGYIRLNRFMATTHQEFLDAFSKLRDKGMVDLILDLEGNGGGYLQSAIDLADEFLKDGQSIVYTEGRRVPREDALASTKGCFEKGRLVIMVGETSASASEIVAGAIQDWDRGVIVGRRTFGKGLVQRAFPLPDASQLKLTIARYYTPSGRCLQKPFADADKYKSDLYDRLKSGELMHVDSIRFADSLKCQTKIQGRIVYGGGGIMPDIFVPLDTTNTDYIRNLMAKNVLIGFVLDYVDKHRVEIKKQYPNFDDFREDFKMSDDVFEQLVTIGKKEKIELKENESKKVRDELNSTFCSLVARNLWGETEFFQIYNEKNPIWRKAVEVLTKNGEYDKLLHP